MLELFSPFYLWGTSANDPVQMGIYARYAFWFIGCSALVEALVRGGEKFIAEVKGRDLLWFQLRTFLGLGLTYLLCVWLMFLVLENWFGIDMEFMTFAGAAGLAVLPRVYTAYGLIPYIGKTLHRLLNIWSLILFFLALRQGVNVESGQLWLLWGIGLGCYLASQYFVDMMGRPQRFEPESNNSSLSK